jgi:hypothetical protein
LCPRIFDLNSNRNISGFGAVEHGSPIRARDQSTSSPPRV